MKRVWHILTLLLLLSSGAIVWIGIPQAPPPPPPAAPKSDGALQLAIPPINFYYVRHGETDSNLKNIVQGLLDTSLNKTGFKQAEEAARHIKDLPITTIITSPLKRARETAKIIADAIDVPVVIVGELKDRSAGILEGKPQERWMEKWKTDKMYIDKAETFQNFSHRVERGLAKALKEPGPILVVAHSGVYTAINKILGAHAKDYLPNAQVLLYKAPSAAPDKGTWTVSEA